MLEQDLIDFEEDIASIYEQGIIRAPIHLRSGNESQLVDIFKNNDVIYLFHYSKNYLFY